MSQDSTRALALDWMHDNPIIKLKIVSASSNLGPGIGRNEGIEKSVGKYITFLDSDDELDDEIFEELTKTIQLASEAPDLVVLNFSEISESRIRNHYRRLDSYLKSRSSLIQDFVSMSLDGSIIAMCFKSSFLKNKNHSNLLKFNAGIFEDIPFLATTINLANSISVIDQDLYVKHKSSNSITTLWRPEENQFYLDSWKQVFYLFGPEDGKYSAEIRRGLRGIVGVCIQIIEETTSYPELRNIYFQELGEVIRVKFPFWKSAYLGPIESRYDRKFVEFAIRYLM